MTQRPRSSGAPEGSPPQGDTADAGGAPEATPAPPVPEADGPVTAEELERVSAERDEYLDALQRLKAEFDNYRRRVERDREALQDAGVREFVSDLLPVIDNLERAVAALGDAGDQIVAGVEMVRGQLAGLLTGRGVREIAAHAEPFDPNVHEAIAQHPTDEHDEGTVVHVVEKGYALGETVIRPAKVIVAGSPPGEG